MIEGIIFPLPNPSVAFGGDILYTLVFSQVTFRMTSLSTGALSLVSVALAFPVFFPLLRRLVRSLPMSFPASGRPILLRPLLFLREYGQSWSISSVFLHVLRRDLF